MDIIPGLKHITGVNVLPDLTIQPHSGSQHIIKNIGRSEHRYPFIIGNLRVPLFFTFSQNPNNYHLEMDKEFNQTQTLGGYTFEHWGKKPMIMSGNITMRKFSDVGGFASIYREDRAYDLQDPIIVPEYVTLRTLFDIDQKRLRQYTEPVEVESNKNTTEDALKPKDSKTSLKDVGTAALNVVKSVGNGFASGSYLNKISSLFKNITSDTFIYYKDTIYSGFFTKLSVDDSGDRPFELKINFNFLVTNTTNDWLVDSIFTSNSAASNIISTLWSGATTANVAAKLFNSFLK